MDKCAYILLNDTIQHLCLTISLWMICKAYVQLGSTQLEQVFPKEIN